MCTPKLSTDTIHSKNSDEVCIYPKHKLVVNTIKPKDFEDLCIDLEKEEQKLLVDRISGKFFEDPYGNKKPGPLVVCGDLCVKGKIKGEIEFPEFPDCIEVLSVKKLKACDENGTIDVCNDVCIVDGNKLVTNKISCKKDEYGKGEICIDEDCILRVKKICGKKDNKPVFICEVITPRISVKEIGCKKDEYGKGKICLDEGCTLLVNEICSKNEQDPVFICQVCTPKLSTDTIHSKNSDEICIYPKHKLVVNTIKPKDFEDLCIELEKE